MATLYEDFLTATMDHQVCIFLLNGVKLNGVITNSDDDSLLLTRDGVSQLIQRDAIATIMPQFVPSR